MDVISLHLKPEDLAMYPQSNFTVPLATDTCVWTSSLKHFWEEIYMYVYIYFCIIYARACVYGTTVCIAVV